MMEELCQMKISSCCISDLNHKCQSLSRCQTLLCCAHSNLFQNVYSNDPKFSNRYAWANSVDPDQIAPRGAV